MTKTRVANLMLQDVPWDGAELASPLTLPGALIAPSYVEQTVQTKPANPAGGKVRLYPKADGKYYVLNAAGTETELGSGGSAYVHPDPFTIGTLTVSTKATLKSPDITGDMSFVADNTYDIGSGAKRPRDVSVARDLFVNSVKTPSGSLDFKPSGVDAWSVAADGHFRPTSANGTLDLGAAANRVRNLYLYSYADQRQINTPAPPPAGSIRIYPKTNGKLYTINSAGVETDLTAVGHVVADPLTLNVGLTVNGYIETQSLEFWHDFNPGTRGPRITADLSSAPNSDRLMFENSVANSASFLGIKPSGTGIGGAIIVYEIDDTPNSPYGIIWNDGTQVNMGTGASGAGIPKDLSIWSSGEKWRVPVTGHFLPGANNAYDIGSAAMALRNLYAAGAVRTGTKAGLPVDADVDTPTDGMMLVDTSTHKLYFRSSAVWRQAGVVPSQQGPVLGLGFDQSSSDVFLVREAANELAQRNGSSAQIFRVYKSYTSDTNYERLALGYSGGNGVLETQRQGSGGNSPLIVSAETLYLRTTTLGVGWFIDNTASIAPESNSVRDIGRTTHRVRDLYLARDLVYTSSGTVKVDTSERMRFDAASNLNSPGDVRINSNAWYNGTDWTRFDTVNPLAHLVVSLSGSLFFYNAPAGTGTPAWSQKLSINAAGLVTISGALTVGGLTTVGQVNASNRMIIGAVAGGAVSSTGGSEGQLEVNNAGSGAAKIAFHRTGSYAAYLGLDTDNVFRIGGWSIGASAYRLLMGDGYANPQITSTGFRSTSDWFRIATTNGLYSEQTGVGVYFPSVPCLYPSGEAIMGRNVVETISGKTHSGHFYMSGGYIFGSYINMTADIQGGSPTYIAGQNGDNYLRWWPKSVISPPADGAVDDANHYVAANFSGTWGDGNFNLVYNGGINIPKAGHWMVGCRVVVNFQNGPGGPGIYGGFHIRGNAGHAHFDENYKPAPDCDHNPGLSTGFGWFWHGHLNPGNVLLYTDSWIYRNSSVSGTMWAQFVGTQSYPN